MGCGDDCTGCRRAYADGALAAPVLHAAAPFLCHLAAARAQSSDGRTYGVHNTDFLIYDYTMSLIRWILIFVGFLLKY